MPDTVIDGDKVFKEKYEDGGMFLPIPGFQLVKAMTGKYPLIFPYPNSVKLKIEGHAFARA